MREEEQTMGGKTSKKRDWKTYNKQLIKRGEFYINPKFVAMSIAGVSELNFM